MNAPSDTPILVVEHAADAGLDLLAPYLGEVRVVRPAAGDDLPDLADFAGLLVLGGAANAYADDEATYLPALRDLLAAAVSEHVPTLAICLGAQLLAVATGGHVTVGAPAGPEVGVVDVRMRPAALSDPVLGPVVAELGTTVPVPALHFDAITELPTGAEWLASSRHYPFQAFRLGSALGVQFHPEASAPALASWVEKLSVGDPAQVRTDWAEAATTIARLARTLATAFSAQVRTRQETLRSSASMIR